MGPLEGSCGSNDGIIWVHWRAHVGLVAESYGSIGGVMWV
jgi:hypothetical protein